MSNNVIAFAFILVAALGLFIWSSYRRFSLVTVGKPENRFDNLGQRLGSMLLFAFGQRRVVARRYGWNHFVIFWAFMILLVANAEFLLAGLAPDYIGFWRLPAGLFWALSLLFDVVSALALVAVAVALIRRAFFAPPYIARLSFDATAILAMIGVLMIAFFGLNASKVALGGADAPTGAFISGALAGAFLTGAAEATLATLGQVFWWVHALVLLAFLNYLPYSKHMHIMTAVPNCFLRSLEKVNTQPREQFERGGAFGVAQVDQFTWKALFDSYSCTECGRCTDVCPAASTGKPLNPQTVIHDIKLNLLHNGPQLVKDGALHGRALPLVGSAGPGSVSEEALWSCTTCGACMEVCPVFIEHVPKIVEMRRSQVEMKAQFPEGLVTVFESIEMRNNPWGVAPAERANWAKGDLAAPFEAGQTEYLFYVGCAGAFDARSRQTTQAIGAILTRAGISWGILGKDEPCCGDTLRRTGNEYMFEQVAAKNVALFKEKGVSKIVTLCPHCLSTLKNDYRQYGLEVEVIHHAQLINSLIESGRLPLQATASLGKVVFHDSCYLGRYNSVFEAPRQAIAAATGAAPLEMERQREGAFCCGAGGGRMWLEEGTGKHINVARLEQALSAEPDTVCVCCPYCLTMFEDALKDKNAEQKVQVLDLAEVVTRALA
ncbi:MAG: (Fe-S)-binding protein [Chloroflexota bacterium]